ncbi:MAG: MiaB/RimO family radical SAM methylthiotransferase [Pseudomonadota bacterium]|nr:MiaB/RimO family radical SAM methylthiotransferase [Pseudomonadota bacterium]
MQAENNKNNIMTLSMGCRLNALESEKIQEMLARAMPAAIVVNTCAVTAEAERQSGQTIRKIARENPNVPIFVTGCAATRNPDLFLQIPNAIVVDNRDKMHLSAYLTALADAPCHFDNPRVANFTHGDSALSKQFIQVQNGCNHECTYCITRALRGPSVSFPYADILNDARTAVARGFTEIVLTGVDTASYARDGMLISDVCAQLLRDVPEIQRLRLSSMDPASPQIFKLIDLMHNEPRMMPHLHLSMQSGCDAILRAMRRRHNAEMVRQIAAAAGDGITFSWDIICGFPGESDEYFADTLALVRATRPIKIHAFPFSPRPDTVAATMPDQVPHSVSKQRVKIITDAANANKQEFMRQQIGKTVQVLVEEKNMARDPHDISVKIVGDAIPARTVCDVLLTDINGDEFIAHVA